MLIDRRPLVTDYSPNRKTLDEYLSNLKPARNPVLSGTRSKTMIPKSKVTQPDIVKLQSHHKTVYDLFDFFKNKKFSCFSLNALN